MTEHETRRAFMAYREATRMGFDAIYADMRAVLGRTTLSSRTLSRFEAGTHKARKFTLQDINEYLKRTKRRKAA